MRRPSRRLTMINATNLTRHGLALLAGVAIASSVVTTAAVASAQPGQNETVTPPTVITHVDAQYPPSALGAREHGDVMVAVTVDVDGHVSKVDVLASGGADLDEAAVVAVRQWTFVPALRAGKPVASRIRVPFHFA
ncbi:MAG: energy transducer TonB, partial [Kofleriaceae bacterium]